MGRELMPCPVCGEECRTTPTAVVCTKCNYESRCANIDCTVQEMLTANVEIHNTLARRAEIGALVEEITGADNMLKVWIDKDEPWIAESYKPEGLGYTRVQRQSTTLLEALRSLAAEIGGV